VQLQPGLEPAQEFSTLAHELAHEILHIGSDKQRNKTVEETEAEAVAHVVCRGAGLDVNTSASDYICLYQGDKDTLLASLKRIRRASAAILRDILPRPSTALSRRCA
jgi:hypothetical protein